MSETKRSGERNYILNLRERFVRWQNKRQQTTFFKRLVLYFVIPIIIAYSAAAVFLLKKLNDERLPYLLDIQLKKSLELEARMRIFLRSRNNFDLMKLGEISLSPEEVFLPRWPLGDEVFVGGFGEYLVFGRYDADTLWSRPLGDLNAFWVAEDSFSYGITTGGLNLGSNRPEQMSAKTGMKRKEVDDFFRSGISSGTRIFKDPIQGERIVSHREVLGTNVVLFQEAVIADLNANRKKFWTQVFFYLTAAIVATIAAAIYFIKGLVDPLNVLVNETRDAVWERRTPVPRFEFHDDLYRIHQVILLIQNRTRNYYEIRKKEEQLRHICHKFFKALSEARTQACALAAAGVSFETYPSKTLHESTITAYFLPNSPQNAIPLLCMRCPIREDGAPALSLQNIWTDEFAETSETILTTLQKGSTHTLSPTQLLVPISLGSIPLGFFVITSIHLTKLGKQEKKWAILIGSILGQALWQLPPESAHNPSQTSN
jgi:hypothetical protein